MPNLVPIPPYPASPEAEKAVIGAVLGSTRLMPDVLAILPSEECFTGPRCRLIWAAIVGVYESGEVVGITSVIARLRATGVLAEAGGSSAITGLAMGVVGDDGLLTHAKIVRERHVTRGVLEVATGILMSLNPDGRADIGPVDPFALSATAIERFEILLGIARIGARRDELEHRAEILDEVILAACDPTRFSSVASGFHDLDKVIGGFRPGELAVLAGRPGSGKSALGLSIALNVTGLLRSSRMDPAKPILFYELEMTRQQTWSRVISAITGIDVARFGSARSSFSSEEHYAINEARRFINESLLHIDTCGSWTLQTFRRDVERRILKYKPVMIIIDAPYIFRRSKSHSTNAELETLFQGVKGVAKDYDIPILALHQLNREVESRHPPRPRLADLRDSGSIEQEADLVMMTYRPEYYNPTNDPRKLQYEDGSCILGTGDVDVLKHRNGPVGSARLAFVKERAMWGDLVAVREVGGYYDKDGVVW